MKTERQLLEEANDIMRSFVSVIDRKGKATNWDALSKKLEKMLREQHDHLYPHDTFHVPSPRKPERLAANKLLDAPKTVPPAITPAPVTEGLTTDPTDPDLGRGSDPEKTGQNKKYLVLSEEERALGYVRPVRNKYVHVGRKVIGTIKELTDEQRERYHGEDYAAYEDYEGKMGSALGRFLSREEYTNITQRYGETYIGGCGAVTTMGDALSETYARDPKFYGATYCVACSKHLPVGQNGEFIWDDGSNELVGT